MFGEAKQVLSDATDAARTALSGISEGLIEFSTEHPFVMGAIGVTFAAAKAPRVGAILVACAILGTMKKGE